MPSYQSVNFATGGELFIPVYTSGLRGDVSVVAVGSIATLITPTTGKRFVLLGGSFSLSAAASVLFEDNSAATANFIYRTPVLAINTPYDFDISGRPFISQAVNNVLKATSSGAANMTGTLFYAEI